MGSLVFLSTMLCVVQADSGTEKRETVARVSIAAAANLTYLIDSLAQAFRQKRPDVDLVIATGSSGSFVAQISHGAPYDVFLSADTQNPRTLVEHGQADPMSFTLFAIGQLALWTTQRELELKSLASIVTDPRVHKIAIANPDTAPYGLAAVQALDKLRVWQSVRGKIVTGENVSQTAQLVDSGNAEVGFVALSLLQATALRQRGHWLLVPADLHSPIEQAAVLTRRGEKNPAAREFLKFLGSPEAREIFTNSGYAVPAAQN